MLRWYLVRTKANSEATALRNLERQGYGVYFPRLSQAMRSRGCWRDRIVPLFPGYLFMRLDEGMQALSPAQSTPGVAAVVRFGASYAIVADEIVSELMTRANPLTGLHRLSIGRELVPGTPIRIAAGPFEGLEGAFQRESGPDRAIVLLSVLGQAASVGVPMENVVARRAA